MQTATTIISCLTILGFIALIVLSIINRRSSKRRIAQLQAISRLGDSDIRSAERAMENLRRHQRPRAGFATPLSPSGSPNKVYDDLLVQLVIAGVITQDDGTHPAVNKMIDAGVITSDSVDAALRAHASGTLNSHDGGFSTGGSFGGSSYSSGSSDSISSYASSSSDSSGSSSCSGGGCD